ncbi:ABC transporter permease, partial [bacterium]
MPLYLLLMLVAALGIGFWLSALNTEYRDVGYVIPFVIQFWMFASPVVYPSSV